MLEVLHNCILNWGGKNGLKKSLFLEWANNVTNNVDERITHLANNLHKYKHTDCLWSQDIKNAFNDLHKSFVLVPLDKAAWSFALIYTRFHASVFAKQLEFHINLFTDTYSKTKNLFAVGITENFREHSS